MKILEINKYYYLRRGAERHLLDVTELLKRHGHELEVFAMQHPKNIPSRFERFFPSFVGYTTREATLWQRIKGVVRIFWSYESRRGIEKVLREWQPDIVHIHNMYHQLSPSILTPLQKLGVPLVMTVHDYNLISPDKDAYYGAVGKRYWKFLFMHKYSFFKRVLLVKKMYWEKMMQFYEKSIDIYIVPSVFVRNVFIQAGFPREKILVLPHFISLQHKAPSLQRAGERTEESIIEKPFALYFGSVSKEKHVNDLVEIFDALQIPLMIAGERANDCRLMLSQYVTVVGQQSREDLEQLILKSACVVSLSPLPETFGLIALEANACGKPFFGLHSGAYPEIIKNGNNGYLAFSKEMLQKYIADFFRGGIEFDASRIQREAYERFGEAKYSARLESLFQDLITKQQIK